MLLKMPIRSWLNYLNIACSLITRARIQTVTQIGDDFEMSILSCYVFKNINIFVWIPFIFLMTNYVLTFTCFRNMVYLFDSKFSYWYSENLHFTTRNRSFIFDMNLITVLNFIKIHSPNFGEISHHLIFHVGHNKT